MAQVTIDTVTYPAWWATAAHVRVTTANAGVPVLATSAVELLPEGVAHGTTLSPWHDVTLIEKVD